jgi:glycosyltransferase involved in cell wall biosynthesis
MNIVHVFRSPLGGLFRHVHDLALEQQARGHRVGMICDVEAVGAGSEQLLGRMANVLELGLHRVQIPRLPHPSDVSSLKKIKNILASKDANIVHGHGAKGGLHARLSGRTNVYTPHGGSLHYSNLSPVGLSFLTAERILEKKTHGFVFVCDFERRSFEAKIGTAGRPHAVVYNGLRREEFNEDVLSPEASDLLFVGEMRGLKGVDLLLQAIAQLKPLRRVTATLVGDGPEEQAFKTLATSLGISGQVTFAGRKPMQEALPLGKVLVLPSRKESFPYVVLEAAATGKIVLAAKVGGVPEILDPSCLFEPDNAAALAQAIEGTFGNSEPLVLAATVTRRRLQREFSVEHMTNQILSFYREIDHRLH